MSRTGLNALIVQGGECCAALERETADCLKHLESLTASEMDRFTAVRRELVTAIQAIDVKMSRTAERLELYADSDAYHDLANFRESASEALRRVIECDGLLIALGTNMLGRQSAELAALANGRQVLGNFGTVRSRQSRALDRSA